MDRRSEHIHQGSILEPFGIGAAFLRMADRGCRIPRQTEAPVARPPGRPIAVG